MINRLENNFKRSMGRLKDWQRKYNEELRERLSKETPEEKEKRHYEEDLLFLLSAINEVSHNKIEKLKEIINIINH